MRIVGRDISLWVERREPDGWRDVAGDWSVDRNRDLFAILEGGYLAESDELPGIAPPGREIPPDASLSIRREAWDIDCPHASPDGSAGRFTPPEPFCGCVRPGSYLTVGELLSYDWMQSVRWTPRALDRDTGRFRAGGRAGHLQREFDLHGALPHLSDLRWGEDSPDEDTDVHLEIDVPVADLLYTDFALVVLAMARLAGGDLDSVRCVYWFY